MCYSCSILFSVMAVCTCVCVCVCVFDVLYFILKTAKCKTLQTGAAYWEDYRVHTVLSVRVPEFICPNKKVKGKQHKKITNVS